MKGRRGFDAPWDGIGSTGNARTRERTGRLSFGGKGKRRTVQAFGTPVPQDSDSDWLKANGEKPQPAMRYGDGGSIRAVERNRGIPMAEHTTLVGARAKPDLFPDVPVYHVEQIPAWVTLENGTRRMTTIAVRYASGTTADRMYTAKADPRDRLAREQVRAENLKVREYERAERASRRIYAKLRKALGG